MSTKGWLLLGGAIYAVTVVIVVAVLLKARGEMATVYGTPQEQAQWNEYTREMDRRHNEREAVREDLSRHSGQPVAAAPPKERSERPPALELLESHFAACLAVSLAGITLLFVIIWGLLMGAMLRPGRIPDYSADSDDAPARAN